MGTSSSKRKAKKKEKAEQPPKLNVNAPPKAAAQAKGKHAEVKHMLIPPGTKSIEEVYKWGKVLGKGHFATVKEGVHKQTKLKYAIKVIDKKYMNKNYDVVMAEVKILKEVGSHRYIVKLVDTFQDDKHFYLIMEFCGGGDLFSLIVSAGKYSEKTAVRYLRQLATALVYIHQHNVTHRDLKPENILLTSAGPDGDLKVADFGLSKLKPADGSEVMKTVCGTWAYCAPEVITRKPYDSRIDNWTLGVLMYILLCGYHPFDVYGDMQEPELLRTVVSGKFDFDDEAWKDVSQEAKDLICKLIVRDPEKRMKLEDFLASDWIMKDSAASPRHMEHVQNRLAKTMEARNKFRGLVMAKLAAHHFRASISKPTVEQRGFVPCAEVETNAEVALEPTIEANEPPEKKAEKAAAVDLGDVPVEVQV